jgi:EAL domain-containing protein (putative c-di-GMP-specific phosphodiesterase class I)
VKLDQPFVRMLAEGQRSASIAQAVILVAHALDLEVTAEGVETDHELQTLICNGCDAMQGFLFRRALPGPEMDQLLADETRLGGTGLEREASAA